VKAHLKLDAEALAALHKGEISGGAGMTGEH